MKKIGFAALCGLISLAFASCTPEVTFNESDLYGTWQEDGKQAFVRFLTPEEDGVTGDYSEYKYGYEWDEDEDVHPEDLTYHGNGWFEWKLETSELTQIHFMDNGGAEIPKIYTVNMLNSSQLSYTDSFKKIHTFTKVVIAE